MKHTRFAVIAGLALVLVFSMGLPASPAKATPPEDLNIVTTVVFDVRQGPPSVSGIWTANGFINSSGDAAVDAFHAGWNDSGLWLKTAHTTEVFTDNQGSITVEAQITNISGRNPISGTGHWVIKDGTGAYTDLHGQGTVSIYGELSFPYLTVVSEYTGIGQND
jgi:hypothetical protein